MKELPEEEPQADEAEDEHKEEEDDGKGVASIGR